MVAAQLTDGTLNSWDYATAGTSLEDGNILPQPLAFQLNPSDPTQADVDFPPVRDESQTTMTLRLVLDDGTNLVTTFTGGAANLGLRGSAARGDFDRRRAGRRTSTRWRTSTGRST